MKYPARPRVLLFLSNNLEVRMEIPSEEEKEVVEHEAAEEESIYLLKDRRAPENHKEEKWLGSELSLKKSSIKN